jgi:hypothetical protein
MSMENKAARFLMKLSFVSVYVYSVKWKCLL